MFVRARDFTFDILRRIGQRIFHRDSSEDKHKKLKHSDSEKPVENSKGGKETDVTRSGDEENQAKEAENIVVASESGSQRKEENDSQSEYNEVSVPEPMETNIDGVRTSKEIKPKEGARVTGFGTITAISGQEPTSTVEVVKPQEQEREALSSFLGTEECNGFKEIEAQAVASTDTVGNSMSEPDSASAEVEGLKLAPFDETVTSKLEALVESASIPEPGSQVTELANSQIKLEDNLECVGTPQEEADSMQPVKSETEQKIEEFSVPDLQVGEVKASDARVMEEASIETSEVLPVIQPTAEIEAEVAESSQDVPVAVREYEPEVADKVQELLKFDAIEKTPVLGDSEMQKNEVHLKSFDYPQHDVYEPKDLIGTEDSIELSKDADEILVEATGEKMEESQFEQPTKPMQPQEVIQSVKDVLEEVTPDEEIKESVDEPVELVKTSEFVNVVAQEISKGDENLVSEVVLEVEQEKEIIEQIKSEEKADNAEFGEKPSASQEDGVCGLNGEASELRQITDTMSEFETMQANEKLAVVSEQVGEQQKVSEAKHIEVNGIQHESELKSAKEVVVSERKQATSSEDVKDEIQHKFYEEVVELGTKLVDEMSSEIEREGESEAMREEPVEIRQESEDPGSKMSEGFEEAENVEVKSPLNEEKANEIQDESKERYHEIIPPPEVKQLTVVSPESENIEKSEPVEDDIREPHQEFSILREESDSTENKVEERVSASEPEKEEIIGSEAEEIGFCERTLVEADIGQEQENKSVKKLQESSETDDVQKGDWMASNAESEEHQTGTEEGTEGEGSDQHDDTKPYRKRRRRHGRSRHGKGKH
nr:expressed protein [Hymenolepis microstoma]